MLEHTGAFGDSEDEKSDASLELVLENRDKHQKIPSGAHDRLGDIPTRRGTSRDRSHGATTTPDRELDRSGEEIHSPPGGVDMKNSGTKGSLFRMLSDKNLPRAESFRSEDGLYSAGANSKQTSLNSIIGVKSLPFRLFLLSLLIAFGYYLRYRTRRSMRHLAESPQLV